FSTTTAIARSGRACFRIEMAGVVKTQSPMELSRTSATRPPGPTRSRAELMPDGRYSSIRASSISITGMSSRIGYTRWHWTHFNPLPSGFSSTVALQSGHTRISSNSLLIAICESSLTVWRCGPHPRPQPELGRGLHFRPRPGNHGKVLAGAFLDHLEAPLAYRLGVDQFAAHRHSACTGFEKFACRLEIHAAGGDHFDMRERAAQRLD